MLRLLRMITSAGLLLALFCLPGCAQAQPDPNVAWGTRQPDGTRRELSRSDAYVNRYQETVVRDSPSTVPVWRTKPGPETGNRGHEDLNPSFVGYEARDVPVMQQEYGMTPALGQWPEGTYKPRMIPIADPGNPDAAATTATTKQKSGGMFGGLFGSGNAGKKSGTPAKQKGQSSATEPVQQYVPPRIALARMDQANTDADGFNHFDASWQRENHGNFSSGKSEKLYKELLRQADTKKKPEGFFDKFKPSVKAQKKKDQETLRNIVLDKDSPYVYPYPKY